MKRVHQLMLAAGALALLSACNGSSSDDDQSGTVETVPASALASPEAYTDYTAKLPASETAEPVSLDTVAQPPASETAEPVALD